MRVARPLTVLFVFALLSIPLLAQTAATPTTSDPQAVSLLQKSLAALTGGATVADVTLTGSAHRIVGSDDETGTAMLIALAPGYSKVSLSLNGGPRVEIRRQATPQPGALSPDAALPSQTTQPPGAFSGPDGALHQMPPNDMLTDPTWFFPALTLARLSQSGSYVFSFVGQETVNGQAVVHLTAMLSTAPSMPPALAELLRRLSRIDIYLDATTSLPVEFSFAVHPDNNPSRDVLSQIEFSNYRIVGGVQVPCRVQRYLNYGLTLDLQFSSAIVNSGIDAAQFQAQ
jgi:hypothetical protein